MIIRIIQVEQRVMDPAVKVGRQRPPALWSQRPLCCLGVIGHKRNRKMPDLKKMELVGRLQEKYSQEVLESFPWGTLSDAGHIEWWINTIDAERKSLGIEMGENHE